MPKAFVARAVSAKKITLEYVSATMYQWYKATGTETLVKHAVKRILYDGYHVLKCTQVDQWLYNIEIRIDHTKDEPDQHLWTEVSLQCNLGSPITCSVTLAKGNAHNNRGVSRPCSPEGTSMIDTPDATINEAGTHINLTVNHSTDYDYFIECTVNVTNLKSLPKQQREKVAKQRMKVNRKEALAYLKKCKIEDDRRRNTDKKHHDAHRIKAYRDEVKEKDKKHRKLMKGLEKQERAQKAEERSRKAEERTREKEERVQQKQQKEQDKIQYHQDNYDRNEAASMAQVAHMQYETMMNYDYDGL